MSSGELEVILPAEFSFNYTDNTSFDVKEDVYKRQDLGIYSLYGSYATLFKNNFQNSEFILMRRYGNNSDFEKYN